MLNLENPEKKRLIVENDIKYWPQERLEQNISKFAILEPDKIAVVDPWNTLTYKELDGRVNDLAYSFQKRGVTKNSVILIQLPNIIEAMIVFHASLRVGAIVLPVTPIYRASEIKSILGQVEPDFIFVPMYFKNNDYISMYDSLELPQHTEVVGVAIPGEARTTGMNYLPWEKFIQNSSRIRIQERPYDSEEYSLLMFTSGTTSTPKGVLHTHGTLGVAISTFDGIETTDDSSVFMVASPVTHITGIVVGILGPMKIGATSILMPIWQSDKALQLMNEYKCTYIMAATPFLSQLIDKRLEVKDGLESLKYFACGGADVSEFLLRKAKSILPTCTFSRIYGSTEAPGISKFQKGYSEEKRYSRDGKPSYSAKVRIKNTSILPDGSGELEVYGPQLFMRYVDWNETEQVLDKEWFSTGDLAVIDEEGFILITGREKDIIIRGGENFSAKEIEDVLIAHPSIEEVTIVGFKDEMMGERACAFVVLKHGRESIELHDLTKLLKKEKIAKQKWPERLEVVDALPYTHSGKLKKYILREMINLN